MNGIRMIFCACSLLMGITLQQAYGEKLILLHTNDTHSQIDPTDKNIGGIQRRKVVIDSIRSEHPHVILADAGDAVQGTLFFTLYGGEVEMRMMDALGYDVAILGNHDFDNGMEALAGNLAKSNAQWISTNYDLTGTDLDKFIAPYVIKEFGDRKVGIIGINLNPKGMISEGNYTGVKYLDGIKAANATAWHLKHNEKVDAVIAVTHLGYDEVSPSDKEVASASEDIDVILGGHSHTTIKPGSGDEWVKNAAGSPVLITQNGSRGGYVSEIEIELDSIGSKLPVYKQIAIDSRLDDRIDRSLDTLLAPYRKGVEEMMTKKIGRTAYELDNDNAALLNFIADFTLDRGREITKGNVDLAITNKGSLRRSLPAGDITQGQIITMQPFDNRIVVLDITGADLAKAFDVMARRDGDGVSEGVEAVYDPESDKCTSIIINGKPLNKEATYRVATIDYLANGGDYMEPLTHGKELTRSERIVYADLIDYIKEKYKGKKIAPSKVERMHPAAE